MPRKEDARLLTGRGSFSDDLNLPGQAYAVMVRSPHAHARIAGIAAAEALALPGVLAVLTGADFAKDGLKSIPHRPFSVSPPDVRLQNRDGSEIFIAPHFPLPADKARFAGEALAMVVAESVQAAKDAAELVHVDYEPLRSTTEAPGRPRDQRELGKETVARAEISPGIAGHHAHRLFIDAEYPRELALLPHHPAAARV